ncbi:hypothetical protein [Modestobacter sp. SSW1-42]|uniref:hypothetical protein n=1 Tax=Modestobacter sp. SSW1-42 TaxID=596372 RepID=UPI00398863BE
MNGSLALFLFAVSQRPNERGDFLTRIWQRDLHQLAGMEFGTPSAFYAALREFAAEFPTAVSVDPGRIGANLSYYLTADAAVWLRDVFPDSTEDDVYDAVDDAGYEIVSALPATMAKALPSRMYVSA